MREQFPWFLDPTEEELQRLWDEATFSFDANVLLNLYRVDRETTEDYFKIFRALGDRIFLPHEAAHQFFRNRRGVIQTEQNSFSEAKKRVRDWVGRRTGFDNLKQQLRGGDIGQIIEDEIESVFEDRKDYNEEVEKVKENLVERIEDLEERFTPTGTTRAIAEEDEILEELMEIFEENTGGVLEEDMEDLKEEAQERYENEQPPGYEDYDEDEDVSRGEFEDFLIWKQLMEYAERKGEDVVFITGEKKRDWWEKDDDYNLVRPKYELLREFRKETEQTFWMIKTERMLQDAQKRIGIDVKDKSVKQTDTVETNDTEIVSEMDNLLTSEDPKSEESYGDRLALSGALKDFCKEIEDEIEKVNRNIDLLEDDSIPFGSLDDLVYKSTSYLEREIPKTIIRASEHSETIDQKYARDEIETLVNTLSVAAGDNNREATKNCLYDLKKYLKVVGDALRAEAEKVRPTNPQ